MFSQFYAFVERFIAVANEAKKWRKIAETLLYVS